MKKVFCSIEEKFVNPLFEVFEGGDLILSSYRDIELPLAEARLFVEASQVEAAREALGRALAVVGVENPEIRECDIPDEDWKFAYRRHFKTELVSSRILVQPEWENVAVVRFDPGMAFGTGKHETTKACLQYIDEIAAAAEKAGEGPMSFLDMGCGSGILSIAAAKLGYVDVEGFDVDQDAVDASIENAGKNAVSVAYRKFALGRPDNPPPKRKYDLVAANILGPLLIRFADEIAPYVGRRIVISGILTELYPEVLAAYSSRGFKEVSRKTIGEWTTGLLER